MAKAGVGESAFKVDFGRKSEDGVGMEVVASYIMRKFAHVEVSRYDQSMDVMDELALPEGVNWLEIERQENTVAQEAALRTVTESGIVAELVGQTTPDGESSAVAPVSSPHLDSQPLFPVQSVFC